MADNMELVNASPDSPPNIEIEQPIPIQPTPTQPTPTATQSGSVTGPIVRSRSRAWDDFTRIVQSSGTIVAKCNHCGKEFRADPKKHGTSGLLYHSASCVRKQSLKDQSEINIVFHGDDEGGGKTSIGTFRFDNESIRKSIATMLILDELPFRFVESKGFRNVMAVSCPRFRVPSRWTISRDCVQLYMEEKKKLRKYFKNNCQRVCLTTDTWTSDQRINYMSLTAHFIDDEWNLRKAILNFCPIGSHKGEKIASAIERCLVEWGINGVFTITMDNTSANDVAVACMKKKLSKWKGSILGCKYMHVRCIAHIINLIVNDGLKFSEKSVYRIRRAVRYVRQSPARLQKFKDCVKAEGLATKSLLTLDVPTRWNSTYLMLESACKFESVFESFNDMDDNFKNDMEACDRDRSVDQDWPGIPDQDDWAAARKLCQCLSNFTELTKFVSGTTYVTCNAYFEEILSVLKLLNQWIQSEDQEFGIMAENMRIKFDKYWGDIDRCNLATFVAAILDPRCKFNFVEFSIKQVYGDIVGDHIWVKIKNATNELFSAYSASLFPQSTSAQRSRESNEGTVTVNESDSLVLEGDGVDRSKKIKLEMRFLFKRLRHGENSVIGESKSELDKYITEDVEDHREDFDILAWWKVNTPRFPILSAMARDLLTVPISTVASESAFSICGRILDPYRCSLSPKIVQALICSQDWFKLNGVSECINKEETPADIDKLEAEIADLDIDSPIEI